MSTPAARASRSATCTAPTGAPLALRSSSHPEKPAGRSSSGASGPDAQPSSTSGTLEALSACGDAAADAPPSLEPASACAPSASASDRLV
eukprot:365949-Chlamydomonas_euryale.AAC.5